MWSEHEFNQYMHGALYTQLFSFDSIAHSHVASHKCNRAICYVLFILFVWTRAPGIFILNFIAFGCNSLFNSFDMAIERYCFLLQFLYLCSSSFFFFSFVSMDFPFFVWLSTLWVSVEWFAIRFYSIRLPSPSSIPRLPYFISRAPFNSQFPFIFCFVLSPNRILQTFTMPNIEHICHFGKLYSNLCLHTQLASIPNYDHRTINRTSKKNVEKKNTVAYMR